MQEARTAFHDGHAHHRVVCECGKLMSQCRCISPNKVETVQSPCTHKTPAEQLEQDVSKWSKFHPFVPDGTAGAFCGSRSPYQDKCGRRESEEVHTQTYIMGTAAPAFVFNPPTASAMTDIHGNEVEPRSPHELKRVCPSSLTRMRRVGMRPKGEDTRATEYFVQCTRSQASRNTCHNTITVYKVVTGSHMVEASHSQGSYRVEDYVYYWPDTAMVLHTGTGYGVRPREIPFCSWKCASLFAAKMARDFE